MKATPSIWQHSHIQIWGHGLIFLEDSMISSIVPIHISAKNVVWGNLLQVQNSRYLEPMFWAMPVQSYFRIWICTDTNLSLLKYIEITKMARDLSAEQWCILLSTDCYICLYVKSFTYAWNDHASIEGRWCEALTINLWLLTQPHLPQMREKYRSKRQSLNRHTKNS